MYGAVVACPIFVVPWKNSTRLTVPSVSPAVAVIVTDAGAVKVAPLAGTVMLAVGGTFADGFTVIATTVDVVMPPELSVARAVRL